jgi:hypothetical protein
MAGGEKNKTRVQCTSQERFSINSRLPGGTKNSHSYMRPCRP